MHRVPSVWHCRQLGACARTPPGRNCTFSALITIYARRCLEILPEGRKQGVGIGAEHEATVSIAIGPCFRHARSGTQPEHLETSTLSALVSRAPCRSTADPTGPRAPRT